MQCKALPRNDVAAAVAVAVAATVVVVVQQ
jgi:hypothetical protein